MIDEDIYYALRERARQLGFVNDEADEHLAAAARCMAEYDEEDE